MPAIEVIVIGGSAGALDVLMAVLPAMTDHDTPIVITLHLASAQPSILPSLLGHATPRVAQEIEDKMPMRRGGLYVAPPNYHVLLERDGTLALSVDDPVQFSRPSIDVLFESAADAYGSAVAGVLLSGANDDGARGLQRIAEEGGVAVIQSPDTAVHPTMPAAALSRLGASGHVVAAERLAEFLTSLTSHRGPGHAS
jgi:two-component system, chemotaxis family, protein-glutamate methylesterase/glutaminase